MASYLEGRTVHVDKHLSNVALGYRPPRGIWDQVFPIVPVDKQSDMILTYNQGDLFRIPSTVRARGAEAQKVDWQVSSDRYFCENYALKYELPDEDVANGDPIFRLGSDEGRVMRLVDFLSQDADNRVSNLVSSTSNVGSSAAIESSWSGYVNARPVDDIFTAIRNVKGATGYRPNRILFGDLAWDHFSLCDQVLNKSFATAIAGGAPTRASQEQIARLFEVDRVLVGESFRNTAEEGIAQSLSRIWNDFVLIYYAPLQPSIELPSFGYSFRWVAPGIPNMQAMRLPHDDKRHKSEVEVGYYQDEVITSAPLGFLLVGVASSQSGI